MRAGKSQFKSRGRYVQVKMGSNLAKRGGIIIQPFLFGVDANELYQKLKAEKDKKESA